MSLKLDRLQRALSVVDGQGLPTSQFQLFWQRTMEAIEDAINGLAALIARVTVVETDISEVKAAPVVLQAPSVKFSGGYVLTSTPTITFTSGIGIMEATFTGDTDDVPEGAANRYFTDARARNALTNGTGMAYDSGTGTIAVGAKLAAYAGGDMPSGFTLGIVDSADAAAWRSAIGAGTSSTTGTVTSVAATVPTGFSVSGSPITTSGTLVISFSTGYSLPTDAAQANWNTSYGWGNHASAGYATLTGTQTLTNKTLSAPTITGNTTSSGVITTTQYYQFGSGPSILYESASDEVSVQIGAALSYIGFKSVSGTPMLNGPGGGLYLGTSGTARVFVNSAAVRANTDATLSLGLSTQRWKDAFIVDPHFYPAASVTPTTNGELVIQATSNTSLTFKLKGTDGTVRSGSITLS